MENKWKSVDNPPKFVDDWWWPKSNPVLVYESTGIMRIATYEHVDEDFPPQWYNSGSDRHVLTQVIYWRPLPLPPI